MKKIYLFILVIMFSIFMRFDKITVEAATKYKTNMPIDNEITVAGTTFVTRQYQIGDDYRCRLVMTFADGHTTVIENTSSEFTTNGKILYYVARGSKHGDYSYKNTIYQYDIKTGKKKKIIAGIDYSVLGCSGKYLYCGREYVADGVNLYALNVKTKKKKHMVNYVGNITIVGNRVITGTNTGAVGNLPMYSFKLNGSSKKKIGDGGVLCAKGKKLYFFIYSYKKNRFKIYSCTNTGKKKKAVTGWVERFPDKYIE